jgi:lysophospholipase L1-like esterase
MKKRFIFGVLAFCALAAICTASKHEPTAKKIKVKPPIEYMPVPSFVNETANYIHYKEQLSPFFEKLRQLKNGEISRLHILHIGDSHLQAGFLPGELRYLLQATFGNAGRGLVFPYQIAKTNAPFDIRTESNIEWECSRNININHDVPMGVCGYSMRTAKSGFTVDIQLKNHEDHFNKVSILGNNSEEAFNIELWGEPESVLAIQKTPFKAGSCFLLDKPRTGMTVSGKKVVEGAAYFTMQGLLLENTENKGILYSAAGVNGASYYSYNRSEQFIEQLTALEPDLIIVSLGTNEAADANMSLPFIQKQVMGFLENLKKNSNCKSILIVTPPDIYLRSRYKTKHSMELAEMMHDVAKSYGGIAIWDFYEVMGGYGSVNSWFNANLAANDRIHYSIEGYKLQAQLLFKAMIKAFEQ